MPIKKPNKSTISICLTGVLIIAAIVFLSFPGITQGASLWIDIIFFAFLNVGLIVALIIGVKTKNKSIMIFSILTNSTLFLIGLSITFIYIFLMIVF